jgi:hypothetical protein
MHIFRYPSFLIAQALDEHHSNSFVHEDEEEEDEEEEEEEDDDDVGHDEHEGTISNNGMI